MTNVLNRLYVNNSTLVARHSARCVLSNPAMKWYSAFPKAPALLEPRPSDCLVSYPRHSLVGGGSYPSAEVQSVYFTAPADWASVHYDFQYDQ